MVITVIVLVCIVCYVIWEIYRITFSRWPSRLFFPLFDKKTHSEDYYLRRDSAAEAMRAGRSLLFEISSDRGEKLSGHYYPCGEGKSRRLAFLVHGYRSEHAENGGVFMELYHSRGFDIFAPDNTASGSSGGRVFGYDVFESEDCLKWLDFLQKELGETESVLHGFSLGGATVMKMSDRLPDCVKFVIEDSGYTDARELIRAKAGILSGLLVLLHRVFHRCDLRKSAVEDNLRRSRVPFLVVHGEEDRTVPFSMAHKVYECCPGDKDFLFSPGVGHIETVHYNREAYESKIDAFIKKYMV